MYKLGSVFHPTDLSSESHVAFRHSLKLALASKAELTLMHVTSHRENVHASSFPSVRKALSHWQVIPERSTKAAVTQLGLSVKKIIAANDDAVEACQKHMNTHSSDIAVLAVHQYSQGTRWLHDSINQPIVESTRSQALIIPLGIEGFVSDKDGSVSLKNILVPIAHQPDPQSMIKELEIFLYSLGVEGVHAHLLYVGEEGEEPNVTLPEDSNIQWHSVVKSGAVVDTILGCSQSLNCELIVMKSEGRHGMFDALRGSTIERVVNKTTCPILSVPT